MRSFKYYGIASIPLFIFITSKLSLSLWELGIALLSMLVGILMAYIKVPIGFLLRLCAPAMEALYIVAPPVRFVKFFFLVTLCYIYLPVFYRPSGVPSYVYGLFWLFSYMGIAVHFLMDWVRALGKKIR